MITERTVNKKKIDGALSLQIFDVETDTNKLLSHCCGLNYRTEGDWSEPVELKPDTEYPDWLWKIDVKRPRPTSDELEYGTLEYFKALEKEAEIRFRSHMKFEKRYRPKKL